MITDPTQIKPGQIRCGEHTDYGAITLLIQDDVGGLEVRRIHVKYNDFVLTSFHSVASWLVALVYKLERSGFEPWSGLLCCVLGQDLSTKVYKWVQANLMLGGNPTIDWDPIQRGVEKILVAS